MRTYLRVGAIVFSDGKLLTTKMRKKGNDYYVVPGGGVESNETILDALKRELKEEAGLVIKNCSLVFIRELNLTIDGGGRGIEFYYYISEYTGKLQKGYDPEEKESVFEALEFLPLDTLKQKTFHPQQLLEKLEQKKLPGELEHLGLHQYP